MVIPFSDEDLKAPVIHIIDTKITPMLAKDGGAIKLLGIKDGTIYVQLQGACVGCLASNTTLNFIVQKELREFIHPELQIINIAQDEEEKILKIINDK